MENITFDNITYLDDSKKGSNLIKYDEYSLASNSKDNSTLKNIVMKNCEINFFFFGGVKNFSIIDISYRFMLNLKNLSFVNNTFNGM